MLFGGPAMQCLECGGTFIQCKSDQRFCSAAHNSKYRQRLYRQRKNERANTLQTSFEEYDKYKEEHKIDNEHLESLRESIRRYHRRSEQLEEIIDKRDDTLKERDKEIERLKLEKRLFNQINVKTTTTFTREHLERVLTSEIRRQFPKDPEIQGHIGAIRAFNASYINALVTA
jgi:hypothetical protein